MKKIIVIIFGISVCLTGCTTIEQFADEHFGTGTMEYTEPEYVKKDDKVWNTINEQANKKHYGYEIDDSFINKYFNPGSLNKLEDKIQSAIQNVSVESGYTKKESELAKKIMEKETLSVITKEELSSEKDILEKALSNLAKEAGKSEDNYLSDIGMTEEDFVNFVEKVTSNTDMTGGE